MDVECPRRPTPNAWECLGPGAACVRSACRGAQLAMAAAAARAFEARGILLRTNNRCFSIFGLLLVALLFEFLDLLIELGLAGPLLFEGEPNLGAPHGGCELDLGQDKLLGLDRYVPLAGG